MKTQLRNTLTYVLCCLLMWMTVVPVRASSGDWIEMDASQLRAQYPDAQIIQVEAGDYPQLAEALRGRGYVVTGELPVKQASTNTSGQSYPQQNYPQQSNDCGNRQGPTAGEESVRVMVDFSSDMMKSGGGNRDSAAVVFVVIGTVLIIVWALYVFKYLYDVAVGFKPCGKWSDFALASSSISSSTTQRADFTGLRYMTGFRDGATEFGISAEVGKADILLSDFGIPELEGLYWFIGPVLRWSLSADRNPHYFLMNFLAGSTEHDEMGVIAQANIGLQFGFNNGFRFGISWGAMHFDLKGNQGILSEQDQYYYLYGVNMGIQF